MKVLVPAIAAALLTGGFVAPAVAQEEMDAQSQRVIGGVIDTLIGNRYATSDREAIRRCAVAAVNKAERMHRGEFRTQPAPIRVIAAISGSARLPTFSDASS